MAVISQPVNAATIQGFRGVLDFYDWKGLHIVRAWPRASRYPPTPGMVAQRAAYGQASVWIKNIPEEMRELYRANTGAVGMSWVDFVKKSQTRNARAGLLIPQCKLEDLGLYPS